MKLAECGRPNPLEEVSGQLRDGILARECEARKRIRSPQRILVALLIKPSIDGNTADLAGGLQQSQRDGQRSGYSLLPAFVTEIAHGASNGLANLLGI